MDFGNTTPGSKGAYHTSMGRLSFSGVLEKPNCVELVLHVVVGNGKNHSSTDSHSCGG